jgi:hypothetical protein
VVNKNVTYSLAQKLEDGGEKIEANRAVQNPKITEWFW